MTALDANAQTEAPVAAAATRRMPSLPKPTKEELQAFGLIGAIAAVWIGATLLFGFGGLIVGALAMVAVMFVVLILISRG